MFIRGILNVSISILERGWIILSMRECGKVWFIQIWLISWIIKGILCLKRKWKKCIGFLYVTVSSVKWSKSNRFQHSKPQNSINLLLFIISYPANHSRSTWRHFAILPQMLKIFMISSNRFMLIISFLSIQLARILTRSSPYAYSLNNFSIKHKKKLFSVYKNYTYSPYA